MTALFRSKSCGGAPRPKASFFHYSSSNQEDDDDHLHYYFHNTNSPITTPFISPRQQDHAQSNHSFTILALLLAALRKSLLTCTVDDSQDVSSLDIGSPTDVHHVSHVTFDRFNGFLGLPLDLQHHVPPKVPSASTCVFGVSVDSLQCSYDETGNSVPTILVMMQKRLYSGGGLQAEGIFRINGENGEEQDVRKQLNRGFVPHGVDVHCLAGLIKAWFRELPRGVLDSLTPEQVMHCNTEEECGELVKSLPPTDAALLDWAINLMADVVKYEQENKMNARNIAMVFAPNLSQLADPLTALIHAVQIMNFLKTLIMKTVGEREESSSSPNSKDDNCCSLRSSTLSRLGSKSEEEFWSFPRKSGSEGILERLSLRKGARKLCRYPVFQLSKKT